MATQTLEELKEENAKKAAETEETSLQEDLEEELEEEAATEETDESEENADSEDDEEEKVVEPWMQSDEQTSQDLKFTDSDVANVRRKLKAKLTEKDDELSEQQKTIADLRAQLEANNSPSQAQPKTRPRLEDFDHDEDAYSAALEDYFSSSVDSRLAKHSQTQQQNDAVEKIRKVTEQKVDKHYERAGKNLIDAGLVSEDDYRNADLAIRSRLDQVRPGMGESLADTFISKLEGEGSEKVWYFLGRNQDALSKLQSTLVSDPSGLDTMVYLGELKTKLTASPAKRVSRAPKPGAKLKGGEGGGQKSKALKKKYQGEDDLQTRISLKRKAKREGHDTSNW